MRWTGWVAATGALLSLSGCVYGMRMAVVQPAPRWSYRPDDSYYCYDCHGDRYFDPYYDWCARYGFRYDWGRHPRVVRIYRERYLHIRERNPQYGRYVYRGDYRNSPRYKAPTDYEAWRDGRTPDRGKTPGRGDEVREKPRSTQGRSGKVKPTPSERRPRGPKGSLREGADT
jgi:hypothetical protein